MNAICLITFRPNKMWCDFLNGFMNYKIFIIVDDNQIDLRQYKHNYRNIVFITIDNEQCKAHGYIDTNFTLRKLISGWDKALYYFGVENHNYEFIWFMEDDVFFYNENSIVHIDKKYTSDLLSNSYDENNGTKSWHWHRITINCSPPYYNGMMCIVRMSTRMMQCIHDYAYKNKTLFFLEALFPTLAIKHNLLYDTPDEFKTVHYRHEFQKEHINKHNLYHPVKNVNDHVYFRHTPRRIALTFTNR